MTTASHRQSTSHQQPDNCDADDHVRGICLRSGRRRSRSGRWQWHRSTRSNHARRRCSGSRVSREQIVAGESLPGAGSVPGLTIPTPVLRLEGREELVWRTLANHEPPVVAARRNGAAQVNLRSVHPDEDVIVAAALAEI